MTIFLAADHAGFKLKEEIVAFLANDDEADLQQEIVDLGPDRFDGGDDYPLYAEVLGKEITKKKGSRGLLFCYSGNGMAIAANKVIGVRCAVGYSIEAAKLAVEHNDANILALPAGFLSVETAKEIVMTFLQAQASSEERHCRRVKEIGELEQKGENSKKDN